MIKQANNVVCPSTTKINICFANMNDQCVQKKKRVTFKKTHENRQIKALLKDFYSQIADKDIKNAQNIKLALASLNKYPLQITSGEGCFILQGFDKKLCRFVDERLFSKKTMVALNEDAIPSSSTKYFSNYKYIEKPETFVEVISKAAITDENKMETNTDINVKEPFDELKKISEFRANPGSKQDAVLIALYHQQLDHPSQPALKKKELKIKAQQYCPKTIDNWSFVKILDQKQKLVKTELSDCGIVQYTLTRLGKAVGKKFSEERMRVLISKVPSDVQHKHDKKCSVHGGSMYQVSPPPIGTLSSDCDEPLFIDMPPASYEIVMLVDKNEPEILVEQGKYVKSESRNLKVGDVIWVARSKISSQELVLPYILERKRMDDFAASIKDGRFHEQKFRLRKCGLRNVIYLLEDHPGKKHCGLPMATLNQAKVNTRVQDGFLVHHTDSLKATKSFLTMMTMRLTDELKNVHLRGANTDSGGKELMTFEYFNASSSKTKSLTIKELFIKMLLQLKGMSVEKALAITKIYNSPKALMNAYDDCDEIAGEMLLASLRFNSCTPKVGPAVSKIIYKLFNKM